MQTITRFFYTIGIVALLTGLYLSLPPLQSGPVDDWVTSGGSQPLNQKMFVAALVAFSLPWLLRLLAFVWSWGNLLRLMLIIGIIGICAAISIPNFRKARQGGLSAGGAKDIQNFRQNLERGYLPRPSDITYEGLFYDYYFNTLEAATEAGPASETSDLFQPIFSWARLPDPLSGQPETFLTVGLRSGRDTTSIKRKRLNLVVVLDYSGSMSSGFNSYYYDSTNRREAEAIEADPDNGLNKLQVACRSIVALLDHLGPDDQFGMVLFDSQAYVAKPLRPVAKTDMLAIKRHILDLTPQGGTNMEAGMKTGRGLFSHPEDTNQEEVENRIIFLTDAMPNVSLTGSAELTALAARYAADNVHCTFIGMGLDFQTELVEALTKIRGANYHSVHSSWEFKKRMDKEFDYMVTPWAYDLALHLESQAFRIEAVYGSPEADLGTGELMRVTTLFPAPVEDDAVKGGVILLKLATTGAAGPLTLRAGYEDRQGAKHQTVVTVPPPPAAAEFCANRDVRKAILLARFVRLMKEWLSEEWATVDPAQRNRRRSYWERPSEKLKMSDAMQQRVAFFGRHFQEQAELIGDPDLEREKGILASLPQEQQQ